MTGNSRTYIRTVEGVTTLRNRIEFRKVGRAVYCVGLENRSAFTGTVGSNPTPSAILKEKQMSKDCGCGRSPTGKCVGWHGLTNEEYSAKLAEYEKKNLMESAPRLLND